MESGRWKARLALGLVGAGLILAAWIAWPRASLWLAKRQAMGRLEKLDERSRAAMALVLADEVRKLPSPPVAGERISHSADGWRFSLPAATYRRLEDPNRANVLESDRLSVHVAGAWSQRPSFKPGFAPTNPEVWRYFQEADPYQLLCDAFTTTPADVRAARSHAELQKALYLLLLRSFLQPVGSDRQWLRFEAGGRKGFLAGQATSALIHVSIYLPETGEFAGIGIAPKADANMDDVFRCLGELAIEKGQATSAPVVPGLGGAGLVAPGR